MRYEHLDVAKGITILVVVFTHSEAVRFHGDELFNILLSFNLTMFFLLSGVFFSTRDNITQFLKKKTASILKPYFSTFLVCTPFIFLLAGGGMLALFLGGVLYGVGDVLMNPPMWFLPHLWLVFLFCYLVIRYTGFDRLPLVLKLGLSLVLLLANAVMLDYFWYYPINLAGKTVEVPGLPWTIDAVGISSFFFLVGYLLRAQLKSFKPRLSYALLCSVVFILCHVLFDARIDLNQRHYTVPVIATLQALSSIYLLLYFSLWLAQKDNALTRALIYMGNASLFVMMFHFPFQKHGFEWLQSIDGLSMYIAAFLAYTASVIISVGLYELIIRRPLLRAIWMPRA